MQTAIKHRFFFYQRFLRLLQATHWSLVSDGGLDADIQIAVSPLKVREKKNMFKPEIWTKGCATLTF